LRGSQPILYLFMVNCARLLHHGSPSAEDNEVWDATHVEPSRQLWIVLRVDLYNDRFPGHIGSRARHLGRRHPAGSAPFSPKVREYRNMGILDDFVERFTINFQGLIHWRQGRFAGAAATGVSEAGRWNAVLSPTGFACSNHRHTYFTTTNLQRVTVRPIVMARRRDRRSDFVF
jgi:hypothetical protein